VPGLGRLAEERDAGRPAGEMVELLQHGRERDRDPEGRKREVEAGEAQGRHPGEEANATGDRRGDRDRPDVAHAVVAHQDRRRVRADRHERAVAERDLPAVARQHIEPEDRE